MTDHRYNDNAEKLDEDLEEVMESHQKEAAEMLSATELHTTPPSIGLETIAKGKTPSERVRHIADERGDQRTTSEKVAEYRLRQKMAAYKERRRALVNEFNNTAKVN